MTISVDELKRHRRMLRECRNYFVGIGSTVVQSLQEADRQGQANVLSDVHASFIKAIDDELALLARHIEK